jgi:RNA polymerase sigma-70 factor (ECF subfamily)
MDRLRQRYRLARRTIPIDAVPEPSIQADDPLEQASAAELLERVREGMAALPDKQAEVFWLSGLEGLSHQQIAEQMEIAPGEVRVLLHRARARLAVLLNLDELHERETQ